MRPLPTLRQLRYLVHLAEHRHFGRAAEDCLVTQSTLSAGIRELEDILGATLVGRGHRQITLTPAGEEVVRRARDLLRAADELVDVARLGLRPLVGLLRLGAIPTIAPYLLPRVLPAVRQAYPELRIYLREEQTARLLGLLDGGRLDGAVIALPYSIGTLEAMVLGEDALLVACPSAHRFTGSPSVRMDDLAGEELLLMEDGHCLREHALTSCRLLPGQAIEALQGTSLGTLVQMVAGGLGLTLIPEMAVAVEARDPAVAVVRLEDGHPVRQITLVWRPDSVRASDLRLLGEALGQHLPQPGPPSPAAAEPADADDPRGAHPKNPRSSP